MHISEVLVSLYGPLQNLHLTFPPGLQIIHGPNESGKTLLIDALIKLLLGSKNIRDFEHIDRVEGMPQGHLRLVKDNQEHILQTNCHLDKLVELSAKDLRNLYVIRNKDLAMLGTGYLQQLSDQLTGMDTSRMQDLRGLLMEAASLTNPTSSAKLSNSREASQLGVRLDKARALKISMGAYWDSAKEQNLDSLELLLEQNRQRLQALDKSLILQQQIQERFKWEQQRDLLAKHQRCLKELRSMAGFTPQRRQQLQEIASHINTLAAAEKQNQENLVSLRQELAQVDNQLLEVKTILNPLMNRKPALDDLYRRSLLADEKQPPERTAYSPAFAWGLLALALTSTILAALGFLHNMFWLTPPVATITALLLLVYNSRLQAQQQCYLKDQQRLLQEAAAQGVLAETMEQLATALAREDDQLNTNHTRVSLISQRRDDLCRTIDSLEQSLGKIRRQADEARITLADNLRSAGVKDLQTFSAQVDQLHSIKVALNQLEDRLQEEFSIKADWQQHFITLPIPPPAPGENDPTLLNKLRKEKDLVQSELSQQRESLYRHQTALADFLSQYREISVPNRSLNTIHHLEDLEASAEALDQFCRETELNRDAALAGIAALEHLETEEALRVADLLAPDKPVQGHFSAISQGRYIQLAYEDGAISVLRHDGILLPADKLSQGTYDQLYLALRVALGRELLGNQPGFFILDDAFLCADAPRTEAMMKILKDLAQDGWQILYFTKDRQLALLAKQYTANSVLELERLK